MIKQKLIGLVLIVLGALPFLLQVTAISDFFETYVWLAFFMPGEIGYQIVIVLLGFWLILKFKPKVELGGR